MEMETEQNSNEPFVYINKLNQISISEEYFNFDVDGEHLYQFNKFLYYQLINFPAEVIPIFDKAINKIFSEMFKMPEGSHNLLQVGIFNMKKTTKMRELNPKDINHLISIRGIVIRCSDIYPEMKDAAFKCALCGHQEFVAIERFKFNINFNNVIQIININIIK